MYAVLALRRQSMLVIHGPPGPMTLKLEPGVDAMDELRAVARTKHSAAMTTYEDAVREHRARLLDRGKAAPRDSPEFEARLQRRWDQTKVEPVPSREGMVRVTMPASAMFECKSAAARDFVADRLRREELARSPSSRRSASPPPAKPPPMPSDADLRRSLGARTTREVVAWTAVLTTGEQQTDLGHVPVLGMGGPPAGFVTGALNRLAADGWSVRHVSEDRATMNETDEIVRARYLLESGAPG